MSNDRIMFGCGDLLIIILIIIIFVARLVSFRSDGFHKLNVHGRERLGESLRFVDEQFEYFY